jgi:putative transposase
MEIFFDSRKTDRTHHQCYLSREVARRDTFEYIEVFYNRSRRHYPLGCLSSAAYHAVWLSQKKLVA